MNALLQRAQTDPFTADSSFMIAPNQKEIIFTFLFLYFSRVKSLTG